ncbi:MAG: cupin domain-containing protein [Cyanobacteria bacterium P01_A01_bin.116]
MEIKNILTELANSPEGTFLDVVPFNNSNISACNITGTSPAWEMHPDTDEFFYILEGTFEITLLTGATPEHHTAPAGTALVIPKGIWHKPAAPNGAKFIYHTPGKTLHSEAEDPRQENH